MAEFQSGQQWYLWFALDGDGSSTRPDGLALNAPPGAKTDVPPIYHVNNVPFWKDYNTVREVSFAGSPNTFDATSRKEARQGNVSTVISGTQRTLTFQIRYKPADSFNYAATDDDLYWVLSKAESQLAQIGVLITDGATDPNDGSQLVGPVGTAPLDKDGMQGFSGNFTFSLTTPQPLNDLVVVDVEAQFSTFGNKLIYDGVTAEEFIDILSV